MKLFQIGGLVGVFEFQIIADKIREVNLGFAIYFRNNFYCLINPLPIITMRKGRTFHETIRDLVTNQK